MAYRSLTRKGDIWSNANTKKVTRLSVLTEAIQRDPTPVVEWEFHFPALEERAFISG